MAGHTWKWAQGKEEGKERLMATVTLLAGCGLAITVAAISHVSLSCLAPMLTWLMGLA